MFRLVEVVPGMLRGDGILQEFEHILTIHDWMIRWFMFKRTITEASVIFMIFVSGIGWNMLRKASLLAENGLPVPRDDDEESDEEAERIAKHLQCVGHHFNKQAHVFHVDNVFSEKMEPEINVIFMSISLIGYGRI